MVRVLWQSNENFFIFFLLKIVKIALKMTCKSFLVYNCPSYSQNFNILYLLPHIFFAMTLVSQKISSYNLLMAHESLVKNWGKVCFTSEEEECRPFRALVPKSPFHSIHHVPIGNTIGV